MNNNFKSKLFLSGGGGAKDSFLLDKEFINCLKKKNILYIPIALQRDHLGYEACYDWIISTLSQHYDGFIDITMWLELNNKNITDLNKFEAIYIGGGNTYKLLQTMNETKLSKNIIEFFRNGGLLYGGSAGAIIMGKNVATVAEENDNNYRFTNGFSLVGNYSLICHYDGTQDNKIKNYIDNYKNPVIALPEKSGLIIENNEVKSTGYEPIVVFDVNLNKRIINPDEIFFL